MTKNKVKYIIIAKKKGKNQKVEEHLAYNEDAKNRIVSNLEIDNYKIKVLKKTEKPSFFSNVVKAVSKM